MTRVPEKTLRRTLRGRGHRHPQKIILLIQGSALSAQNLQTLAIRALTANRLEQRVVLQAISDNLSVQTIKANLSDLKVVAAQVLLGLLAQKTQFIFSIQHGRLHRSCSTPENLKRIEHALDEFRVDRGLVTLTQSKATPLGN
ncbi:hypothetical protein DEDE109153_08910 [Deinococcus deserti]|uniref:Uncharacterized protein n=1 Tax=Deinococcus deserti (strain DSM 17065 / CIP 109153 / LMG 22923 / VCD115) TaxID=546414 RepID=X5GYB8_DEIDV|nr:hypothetical protein [Deinococcus deserti]AHX26584.1 hypothetical protein Deide_3p02814 [Deinococcus deserti VCD115]